MFDFNIMRELETDEKFAVAIFSLLTLVTIYYAVRLALITRVWRSVWFWFIGSSIMLGFSRGTLFGYNRAVICPVTVLDHALFLYAPTFGAFCLMMAVRGLFKMFYRYMDMDHLRAEMKNMDKYSLKDKNK